MFIGVSFGFLFKYGVMVGLLSFAGGMYTQYRISKYFRNKKEKSTEDKK